MKLSVNRLHFPVTTLGYGNRLGIWLQGCSIHCPGCLSKDTWERNPEMEIELEEFLSACQPWLENCDGVTVSGGEPFDQPFALIALVKGLRERQDGDILVFSGYSYAKLSSKYDFSGGWLDVLISEPYQPSAGQTLMLRGSDNQRVHLFTPLAKARYPSNLDTLPWSGSRKLDLAITEGEVWMAGIPEPNWGERFRAKMLEQDFIGRTSDMPTQPPTIYP